MRTTQSLLGEVARQGRCQSAILELWTPPADSIDATVERGALWAEESLRFPMRTTHAGLLPGAQRDCRIHATRPQGRQAARDEGAAGSRPRGSRAAAGHCDRS